jgi:hypothetical protein
MAINKLNDFEVGIYANAREFAKERNMVFGAKAFDNYLDKLAGTGDISGDVLPDPEERKKVAGKPVSALQAIFAKAGVKITGRDSSSAGVFFSKDATHVDGMDVLFGAFVTAIYDDWMNKPAITGGGTYFTETGSDGDLIFPTVIRDTFRDFAQKQERMLLKLMLSDIVSFTTGITGDAYKAGYIDYSADDDNEPRRVAEGADLPLYQMVTGENAVKIHKYGGRVKASYEMLRRQRINKVVRTIQGIARREEWRKLKAAIAVGLNGDGNSNAALNANSGASSWNLQDFTDWAIDVAYGYDEDISIVVTDSTEAKSISALKQAASNLALTPEQLGMYRMGELVLPTGIPMKIGPSGSAMDSSTKIMGWNQLNGLEQIVENGSLISEAERFTTNQTEQFTISENVGYAKPDLASFHTLTRSS